MTVNRFLPVLLLSVSVMACEGPAPGDATAPAKVAGTLDAAAVEEQVVLPTSDYLQLPRYASADTARGERLAMQCRACHSLEAGGPNMLGPNLHGFFGRQVGTVPGFPYSQALVKADFVWTPETLDAWLAQPSGFLPGNRMAYAGLADADDRNAVIAALLQLTSATGQGDGA